MIKVGYTQEFIRAYDKLPTALKEEVKEKIELFKDRKSHQRLKVHKLHGRHTRHWGFSVNYAYRIMFDYLGKGKNSVALLTVGDHDIYK